MKITFRSIIAFTTLTIGMYSTEAQKTDQYFLTVADVMPRYAGCDNVSDEKTARECTIKGIGAYLKTIKYPRKAKEKDQQGKVFVRFIVNQDGTVGDVKVGDQGSGHHLLDSTAIAHIKKMPDWIPGMHEGELVRVQYTVPINFKFREPAPMDDLRRKKKKKKKK